MRAAVLGGGAWGTALAQLLAHDGAAVTWWMRDGAAAEAARATRRSPRLPGVTLAPSVVPTAERDAVADAALVLVAVPVQAMGEALAGFDRVLRRDAILCLCSKGMERGTLALPAQVAERALPGRPVVVLSGPSFAQDVAVGLPTAVTLAGEDLGALELAQRRLTTPAFRPYGSDDPLGAQVGGAVKNVLAIACGIAVARGLGPSAHAALVARGHAEMVRLALAMGAKAETIQGLSGLGDLVLTCGSDRSRNFALGLRLGDPDRETEAMGVSEGAKSAAPVLALAGRANVEMPVCAEVESVLDGGSVGEAVERLLARPIPSRESIS